MIIKVILKWVRLVFFVYSGLFMAKIRSKYQYIWRWGWEFAGFDDLLGDD